MSLPKVQITENLVYVDGVEVGRIDGRGEVYAMFKDKDGNLKPVGRWKYRSAKSHCKDWVKFILKFYKAADLVDTFWYRTNGQNETPIGLAEKHGYVHPNLRRKV